MPFEAGLKFYGPTDNMKMVPRISLRKSFRSLMRQWIGLKINAFSKWEFLGSLILGAQHLK